MSFSNQEPGRSTQRCEGTLSNQATGIGRATNSVNRISNEEVTDKNKGERI